MPAHDHLNPRLVDPGVLARVKAAVENATRNGHQVATWDATDLAEDMCAFDADLEAVPVEVVEAAIQVLRLTGGES